MTKVRKRKSFAKREKLIKKIKKIMIQNENIMLNNYKLRKIYNN